MINKIRILNTKKEFYKTNPVLIHGTSVESAIELFKKNKIDISNKDKSSVLFNHPINNGYLFFMAIKEKMMGHSLYHNIEKECKINFCADVVKGYASGIQQREYLNQTFGHAPCWESFFSDFKLFKHKKESLKRVFKVYKKFCKNKAEVKNLKKITKYNLKQLNSNLEKRKGVLLGINEKIFETNIENGCDTPGYEVMIHLPNGFKSKYVGSILPLGKLERNLLKNFQNN